MQRFRANILMFRKCDFTCCGIKFPGFSTKLFQRHSIMVEQLVGICFALVMECRSRNQSNTDLFVGIHSICDTSSEIPAINLLLHQTQPKPNKLLLTSTVLYVSINRDFMTFCGSLKIYELQRRRWNTIINQQLRKQRRFKSVMTRSKYS